MSARHHGSDDTDSVEHAERVGHVEHVEHAEHVERDSPPDRVGLPAPSTRSASCRHGDPLLVAVLEALDHAALLVDGQGRIVVANRSGWRLASPGAALGGAAPGQVVPCDPPRRRAWREALAAGLDGEPTLLVLAARPPGCEPGALRAWARLRGLTPAEAQVLAQLAQGLSPAEVAARHRRAVCTVRTQVRNILAKLDLHGLQSLVAEALRLPPMRAAAGVERR